MLFTTTSIMTTSSRMVYAFARYPVTESPVYTNHTNKNRDGGLPASPFFCRVHPKLKVPLNALYFTVILVIIFGCIFLGSSSAFNAIVSASVVMLDIAYGIPIAVNCLRGRNMLPERQFVLPNTIGWILNIVRFYHLV